jgi:transcriptional regulator with XRE-family HTH domain
MIVRDAAVGNRPHTSFLHWLRLALISARRRRFTVRATLAASRAVAVTRASGTGTACASRPVPGSLSGFSSAGPLLRDARLRHGLDQRVLAHRAGTSQTQISRIERGKVSPSVETLSRLLAAVGERLELTAAPASRPGARDYIPDHTAERRREFSNSTPSERVSEAIRLSRTATRIAAAARRHRL